jgi:hypothetical protein
MDQSEAKRKWRRRLVLIWVLVALAAVWLVVGYVIMLHDYTLPVTATVNSEQCPTTSCDVYLTYVPRDGSPLNSDYWTGIPSGRIHVLDTGGRVVTLYYHTSNGSVTDTPSQFWDVVEIEAIGLLIIGIALIFTIRGGQNIRRQAKTHNDGASRYANVRARD